MASHTLATWMFIQPLVHSYIKNIKCPHHWYWHRYPQREKGSLIWKAFPCHHVIMHTDFIWFQLLCFESILDNESTRRRMTCVFSFFRCMRSVPLPPHLLLLLTTIFGTEKYISRKTRWMRFLWPRPRVTAVTLNINNYCRHVKRFHY